MIDTEPVVSVVMPARNREREVMRAIESVRSQTETKWELVLVDDASSPPLAEKIGSLQDSRIIVISNEERRGAAASRNRGIRHARSRTVALLDSDDIWLPRKLEMDLEFLRPWILNAEDWFAIGQIWIWTDGALVAGVPPRQDRHERLDEEVFVQRRAVQSSSLLMPTRLLREIPFDEGLARLQDWDLVFRLWRAGAECVVLPDRSTVYVDSQSGERISNTNDPDLLASWIGARHNWFSDRAVRGFYANKVAPELVAEGRRMAAAAHIISASRYRAFTVKFLALETARVFLPTPVLRSFLTLYRVVDSRGAGVDETSIQTMNRAIPRVKSLVARRLLATKAGRCYFVHRNYLGPIGWDRSAGGGTAVSSGGDALPWITYPAIRFLTSRLPSHRLTVFEWGSGMSTVWWARLGHSVVSCEHDVSWYLRVLDGAPDNAHVILRDVDSRDYVDCIKESGPFDVIVIDGRRRSESSRVAIDALTVSGVLVWDNTEREKYSDGIQSLMSAGFRRVDFAGLAPGTYEESITSIFYREGNLLGL